MKATADNYREILEELCNSIVAERAAEVDGSGVFPDESIAALKEAGLLGAVSAP